jgi:predicted amidohydrolase
VNKDDGPRKVVVGTVMQGFWGAGLDLDGRIEVLLRRTDELAAMAAERWPGRGLDLAVLPETVVTTGADGADAAAQAVPLEGLVADAFGEAARRHSAYIVVGMMLADDERRGVHSNAAVLFDRSGEVAGIYRKLHPVAVVGRTDLERGVTPGLQAPVFECDFGRLGMQICWDMCFDDGWDLLGRKGAEIIAWPSASPQTLMPAWRARRLRCYVVTSTPRENATIFDPAGLVAAQALPPQSALVAEIDLSCMVLPWASELRNGQALTDLFGERVGYRYSVTEDCGLFWSNDPALPIGHMARRIGMIDYDEHLRNNVRLVEAARSGPLT